jgi:hypothetical protein
MYKHSASNNNTQTNPFGSANKSNAPISITSAMSNTSTAAQSASQNPFSKPLTYNSNNAFLRPNNQPIPLLGSTQTNQSQIISNTGQLYGGQKTTSNFMNTNTPFGSASNNSIMQSESNSNLLNLKKPNSNIFSNTTNNFQNNSPNIYSHNPSANTSPFGLSQSKTQFNAAATSTSFKPIKTENAKLDPRHFVSCIAMEKKYLDQKLSK